MNHPMLRFCYKIPATCVREGRFTDEAGTHFKRVDLGDRQWEANSWAFNVALAHDGPFHTTTLIMLSFLAWKKENLSS